MANDKLARAVEMMIRTDHMHKYLIDTRVRDIGIHRTQHRILMHLARHEHLRSQKALADHLDITPAAVTGALKKIEADGYIERALGKDNRYNEIRITEKGRALVKKTKEVFSSTDVALFDGFSARELDVYVSCLEKLESNIKRQLDAAQTAERKQNEKMV